MNYEKPKKEILSLRISGRIRIRTDKGKSKDPFDFFSLFMDLVSDPAPTFENQIPVRQTDLDTIFARYDMLLGNCLTSSDSEHPIQSENMKGKLPRTQSVPTRCQLFLFPYTLNYEGTLVI